MPYRSMLLTVLAIAFALLLVGWWLREVEPLLAAVSALPAGAGSANAASRLRGLVRGTLLLSFLLIFFLLVVGLSATAREFLRRKPPRRIRRRTHYVDAWKLAGERLGRGNPEL